MIWFALVALFLPALVVSDLAGRAYLRYQKEFRIANPSDTGRDIPATSSEIQPKYGFNFVAWGRDAAEMVSSGFSRVRGPHADAKVESLRLRYVKLASLQLILMAAGLIAMVVIVSR